MEPADKAARRRWYRELREVGDQLRPLVAPKLADVRDWLARHGIQADTLLGPAAHDAGGALLDLARAQAADLLVMGCYGHSRLRELCLGGASRTVLAETEIPVLLAH
jgi:nucleotide-binding universal stress UspA family protein